LTSEIALARRDAVASCARWASVSARGAAADPSGIALTLITFGRVVPGGSMTDTMM
jgi:hypothetical protein